MKRSHIYIFFTIIILILPLIVNADDFDGDGMPDDWERRNGLRVDMEDAKYDYDYDGLTNLDESSYHTDPYAYDSDGDGYDDKEEIDRGSDPLDPKSPSFFNPFILLNIFIGTLIAVLLFLLFFYLFTMDYKKIFGRKAKPKPPKGTVQRKPIGYAGPARIYSRGTQLLRSAARSVQTQKQVISPDQRAKIRSSLFGKFDTPPKKAPAQPIPTTKKQDSISPPRQKEQPNKNNEENAIDELSMLKKKEESSLDKLKEVIKEEEK